MEGRAGERNTHKVTNMKWYTPLPPPPPHPPLPTPTPSQGKTTTTKKVTAIQKEPLLERSIFGILVGPFLCSHLCNVINSNITFRLPHATAPQGVINWNQTVGPRDNLKLTKFETKRFTNQEQGSISGPPPPSPFPFVLLQNDQIYCVSFTTCPVT